MQYPPLKDHELSPMGQHASQGGANSVSSPYLYNITNVSHQQERDVTYKDIYKKMDPCLNWLLKAVGIIIATWIISAITITPYVSQIETNNLNSNIIMTNQVQSITNTLTAIFGTSVSSNLKNLINQPYPERSTGNGSLVYSDKCIYGIIHAINVCASTFAAACLTPSFNAKLNWPASVLEMNPTVGYWTTVDITRCTNAYNDVSNLCGNNVICCTQASSGSFSTTSTCVS